MFGKEAFKEMWSTSALRWVWDELRLIEDFRIDPNEEIPVIFYEAGNSTLKSVTPSGVEILPHYNDIKGELKPGVIHTMLLISGGPTDYLGRPAYFAVGTAWRTLEYWYAVFSDNNTLAVKMVRMMGYSPKEAVDCVNQDFRWFRRVRDYSDILRILAPMCDWSILNEFEGTRQRSHEEDYRNDIFRLKAELETERTLRQEEESSYRRKEKMYIEEIKNEKKEKEFMVKMYDEKLRNLTEELEEALTMLQDQPDQDNYNAWAIIGANPSDASSEIKKKLMRAINLYHPDKVAMAGPILREQASNITRSLLDLKRQL